MMKGRGKNARFRVLQNSRGISLVELITAVAIMAILSVVVGALLTSATNSYAREKDYAAAKEISQLVSQEIERRVRRADHVMLADMPAPAEGEPRTPAEFSGYSCFYSQPADGAAAPDPDRPGDIPGWFFSDDAECFTLIPKNLFTSPGAAAAASANPQVKAFYGKYLVLVRYEAVKTSTASGDRYSALRIYADVYRDGKRKYRSLNGRTVVLLKGMDPKIYEEGRPTQSGNMVTDTTAAHGAPADGQRYECLYYAFFEADDSE